MRCVGPDPGENQEETDPAGPRHRVAEVSCAAGRARPGGKLARVYRVPSRPRRGPRPGKLPELSGARKKDAAGASPATSAYQSQSLVRRPLIEWIVAQREHEDVVVRIEALIRRSGSRRKAGEGVQLHILILRARNRPSQLPLVQCLP